MGGIATILGAGAILVTLSNLDRLEQRYDAFFKRTLAAGQEFANKLGPILKAMREGKPVEGFQETVEQAVRDRINAPMRETWPGAEPTKNVKGRHRQN